jgi:hypothetical protein
MSLLDEKNPIRTGLARLCALCATVYGNRRPVKALLGIAVLLLVACGDAGSSAHLTGSTQRMVGRLADLAAESDGEIDTYLNDQRVEMYRGRLAGVRLSPQERIETHAKLGNELLVAGRTEEALETLQELMDQVLTGDASRKMVLRVRELLALAWLRLGEEQNCIEHHGTESCLMPIQGSGLHQSTEGSINAMREFGEILEMRPKNLEASWLLNIAAMTLDRYPDGVRPEWLIPPEIFESEADVGRFVDVAGERGVDVEDLCGGVCLEDFDLDGDLDLMASSWDLHDQLRYFENDGRGFFTERTEEAGLTGLTGGLNMVHADYDNDGLPDVFVLRGAWRKEAGRLPNSLLRNLGGGRFSDVTEETGLLSMHPTQTAAWGDYDNDGWLDLFIGNETIPGAADVHPCELYHNDGGMFTEVAARVGLNIGAFVKGVVFGDYDNDGYTDLYLSRNDGPNLLMHNDGPRGETSRGPAWSFSDRATEAGVTQPDWSFPTWWFDYDNDGLLDLWVSGYQFNSVRRVVKDYLGKKHGGILPRLYRNRGDGTFEDATVATRADRIVMTMGCNYGDIDNDGWLDYYAGTGEPDFRALYPNRMFLNRQGEEFLEVTTSGGFGHLQKGHAIAFGDIDADGDQDVYAVMGGAFTGDAFRNALFLNPGQGNHWLKLRLEGVEANRSAIGARVRVRVTDAAGAARDIHVHVGTGGSFGSQSLQAEIGLGDAASIDEVEVRWPGSGLVQRIGALERDAIYAVKEGAEPVRVATP